jgi:hypothetical protein
MSESSPWLVWCSAVFLLLDDAEMKLKQEHQGGELEPV